MTLDQVAAEILPAAINRAVLRQLVGLLRLWFEALDLVERFPQKEKQGAHDERRAGHKPAIVVTAFRFDNSDREYFAGDIIAQADLGLVRLGIECVLPLIGR
ncbi:hypothetical protein D3C80_1553640 [compost metagenome]